MIKFTAKRDGHGGPLLGLGLTKGNLARLEKGRPMRIVPSELGLDWAGEILIFYGADEAAIESMLRSQGLIGPDTKIQADASKEHL